MSTSRTFPTHCCLSLAGILLGTTATVSYQNKKVRKGLKVLTKVWKYIKTIANFFKHFQTFDNHKFEYQPGDSFFEVWLGLCQHVESTWSSALQESGGFWFGVWYRCTHTLQQHGAWWTCWWQLLEGYQAGPVTVWEYSQCLFVHNDIELGSGNVQAHNTPHQTNEGTSLWRRCSPPRRRQASGGCVTAISGNRSCLRRRCTHWVAVAGTHNRRVMAIGS